MMIRGQWGGHSGTSVITGHAHWQEIRDEQV